MVIGKFYGIGAGPGDPNLLTLRAKEVLEKADIIFAPISKEGRRSIALEAVGPFVKGKEVTTLLFPMHKDEMALRPYWEKAGSEICKSLRAGRDAAFVTIGDPTFYSTYTYVMKIIEKGCPDAEIETIPGVPSLLACSSELNMPIVERDEKLAVLPAEYGLERLEELAGIFDTIVLMKVSRNFKEIKQRLEKAGLKGHAVVATKCGTDDFHTSPLADAKEKVDFMSMIIIIKVKR